MAVQEIKYVTGYTPQALQDAVMEWFGYWQPIIGISVMNDGMLVQPMIGNNMSPFITYYGSDYHVVAATRFDELAEAANVYVSDYYTLGWPLGPVVQTPGGILVQAIMLY